MKRIRVIIVILLFILLMMFNRDNAHDEVIITLEEPKYSLETQWRDMIVWKVDNLLGDYIASEIIVDNCMATQENYILCIKNVVWVANAESTLFKRVSKSNNPFWLMKNGKLQKFDSIYDAIEYRITLYTTNNWHTRTSWADWIAWKYCASEYTYRVQNYNDWISKLKFN